MDTNKKLSGGFSSGYEETECSPGAWSQGHTALSKLQVTRAIPFPRGRGKLVAYIRYTEDDPWDAGRQLERIQDFCAEHGYRMERAFEDSGKASFGLTRALEALTDADGLIAVDLDRFIRREDGKTRDLRPLVHEFIHLGNKHLVTLKEGLDTSSPAGERSALDFICGCPDHDLDLD